MKKVKKWCRTCPRYVENLVPGSEERNLLESHGIECSFENPELGKSFGRKCNDWEPKTADVSDDFEAIEREAEKAACIDAEYGYYDW